MYLSKLQNIFGHLAKRLLPFVILFSFDDLYHISIYWFVSQYFHWFVLFIFHVLWPGRWFSQLTQTISFIPSCLPHYYYLSQFSTWSGLFQINLSHISDITNLYHLFHSLICNNLRATVDITDITVYLVAHPSSMYYIDTHPQHMHKFECV